ncbi:hypothetical protein A4D02_34750 [Niastella koreensis]|uniref:Amino acid adenylation domain protein n=2 Tax=Niastella koreensis TaxID=354356 RepID=G8TKK0_NIAKG|nr:non-ribosomal peptide synthetase [Niastella koreensis]AEV98674.1 amino acid adenylation domain protein [Niastella koreensis GR20-10]OQP44386.1 hypothetical protein A4D02_34750 [Niastella koreensis]
MKNVKEIIKSLRASDIRLSLNNNELVIEAGSADVSEELLAAIQVNKEALLTYLRKNSNGRPVHSIKPVEKQDSYPLSSSQRRLWILNQLTPGSIEYNIPGAWLFEGQLNEEAFAAAFKEIVNRHESLRTVFKDNGSGEARQFICDVNEPGFAILNRKDLRNNYKRTIAAIVQEDLRLSFDLSTGPLVKGYLYQLEDNKWVFAYVLHHIITDGWSMGILIHELLSVYNALSTASSIPLSPLHLQYRDYAVWQQEQLQHESMIPHKQYWLKQMEELPVLQLPADRERPAVKTNEGGIVSKKIEKELAQGIRQLAQEQRATLFMGLMTVVNILLHRYSAQDDIVVGTPIAGRTQAELEGQIGLFLNTLPIRARFKGENDFKTVLQIIRTTILEAQTHQAYPLDELLNALPVKRETGRSAFFDVLVDFHENSPSKNAPSLPNLQISGYEAGEHTVSKFDLTFMFAASGEDLNLSIEYNKDLYEKETIERLHTHFSMLLTSIIAAPEGPVNKHSYIPSDEMARLLKTGAEAPAFTSVLSLFQKQVAGGPGKTALIFGDTSLTFSELDELSTRLAHYLKEECSLKSNNLVGILLDRSENLIIAMLGVLKAGAAYVPVDTAYPPARQEQIIRDAGMKVMITQTAYAFDLSYYEGTVFAMDVQLNMLQQPPVPLATNTSPEDTAYVIFTSGSTGKPKGCSISHGNLSNYIQWCCQYYFTNAAHGNFGLYTSLSFDLTVTGIFCTLVRGNTLYIYAQEAELSEIFQHSFAADSGINCIKLTPSHINYLQNLELGSTTMVSAIVGGEELLPKHVDILKKINPAIRIFNEYGPTEATVGCMIEEVDPNSSITIGKPIDGAAIYILDEQLGVCGTGIPGEICVGGAGVCKGYLGQSEMTAEKFVQNPYKNGDRLYRTGDTGRRLNDGRIVYTGRKDDQVKIRGYRVELGDVEAALTGCPGVTAAAVIARPDKEGLLELIAYVAGKHELTADAVRHYINKVLPAYIVPSHVELLSEMPLTAHGKVDRKALPEPAIRNLEMNTRTDGALTSTEERLITLWSDVLSMDRERITARSDFFERGGHSLRIARLATMIYKEFEVKIELRTLFTVSILEEQAKLIAESKKMAFDEILPVENRHNYDLSSSQRRLWILSKLTGGNAAYTIPGAYVFDGEVNYDILNQSFRALIRRHESLRTIFKEEENGVPKQFVLSPDEAAFNINYTDLIQEKDPENRVKDLLQQSFTTTFDLSTGPLISVNLYRVAKNKWIFTYVIHHIISDDLSTGILIKELMTIYNAFLKGAADPLPPLRIQYKDYAAWQQQQLKNDQATLHKNYWKLCFEGELPVLALPGDNPRPPVKTYTGGIVRKWLSPSIGKAIKSLTLQQDATLFMGLLAAVNALLYRYTGQEDIVLGSSIASRQHPDLENQIGFYVNTLALRTRFNGENSFEDLLENVKQVTLGAYEHQSYPFDELVEQLNLQRDISRHPLFEVMVVLQRNGSGSSATGGGMGDFNVSRYDGYQYVTSKFDMTFFFTESGGNNLHVSLIYNNTIYKESTADRMLQHFEQLLNAIVEKPATPVCTLNLLSATESEQLLTGFTTSAVDYPKQRTVVGLFREQARKTPENIALIFGSAQLTYCELDERSDRIAAYLRANYHIDVNSRVGMMLDRSEKMIVALLAILKAGAAYVPVDPDYPVARKKFMLADSEANILITESQYLLDLDYYTGNVFAIDIQADETVGFDLDPQQLHRPDSVAYVIYTSGSTGQPKGVMISHRSLVDYVYGFTERTNVKDCATFGLMSTLAADLGNTVIYSSLLLGGCLHIFSASAVMSPEIMAATALDCIKIVPSHWKALQEENRSFIPCKTLVFGGEPLTHDVLDKLKQSGAACEVYNHYGPTETTIGKLLNRISLDECNEKIALGTPFGNTRVYIVDAHGELAAMGIPGEICISGDGLALGYLNRPELTNEKFIEAPFKKGEQIYKTGDLGRWLANGKIEFIGRKDGQIKIRGFRVEIGEIENALLTHPAVKSVAVVDRLYDKSKVLIAYVSGHHLPGVAELQSYLGNILPSYMVPGHFIFLSQLPLTANGKIDRKSLPDPEEWQFAKDQSYIGARNGIEAALIKAFELVLKKNNVGINDSFFALGGDSIKAIQIIAQLKKMGYGLSIQDILLIPVIEQLAGFVKLSVRSINQETVTGLVPLSPIQNEFLESTIENKAHYNQSVLLVSKHRLHEEALKAVFDKIIQHHDALRMVFIQTAEGWKQENKGEAPGCAFKIVEWENETEFAAHCDRMHASFDLENGPLFKICLFRAADGDRLLLVAHHLIIDGVSWRVILEDVSTLYDQYVAGEAFSLPEKSNSFKDWMEKQLDYAHSNNWQEEESYWNIADAVKLQPLAKDFSEGSNLSKDTVVSTVQLSEEQTDRLLTKSYKAYKTDINDVLLTALSISIHDMFNIDKVVVRLEGHGREYIGEEMDISRTIGWFTTHYPVVLDVKDGNTLRQLLEVKEYLHRVPGKGIGYGILKYLAGKKYTISPEISFNYLGGFGSGGSSDKAGNGAAPLFKLSGNYKGREIQEDSVRDMLLNVNCIVVDGKMRLSIAYSQHQFKQSTIDAVLASFRLHLENLIEILSKEDKTHFTPVDFTYKGLKLDQLEELDKL